MGKFDFVAGNPLWKDWQNLLDKYCDNKKNLWNTYGLLEKTDGASLGKVKRDMGMLFTVRYLDRYVSEKSKFAHSLHNAQESIWRRISKAPGNRFAHCGQQHL
jgi:hypothetical protein